MDKLRDRIERIEKKMRMKLHLQHLQARLGKPGLELRGLQFPLSILSVVKDRLMDRYDSPVDRDRKVEVDEEKDLVGFPKGREVEPREIPKLWKNVGVDGQYRKRDQYASRDVYGNRLLPLSLIERKPVRQEKYERADAEPDVARHQLP